MKRLLVPLTFLLALVPVSLLGASAPSAVMKSSTVFVANYSDAGDFIGWGSGFFVDEGIVVTNRHVIEKGDWYRVYVTGPDDKIDMNCFKKITKGDIKINLNDDVAYLRVFLPCSHGTMTFADDPADGDRISVMGYPYEEESGSSFLELKIATGSVTGRTPDGWRLTDAHLDIGNSGGPVVNETEVVGVAVAKGVDADGGYVTGFFIPSSVILSGLLYANDSGFGYTPQVRSSSSRASSSHSFSSGSQPRASSSSIASSSRSSRSASASSRRPSAVSPFPDVPVSHPAYDAILALYRRGVIGGYPDGTYRPGSSINRAEFIRILVAGFRGSAVRGEGDCFLDVANQWFAPYVCAAKRLGWIDGYPDGTFRASQPVNRAEAMKILVIAFGGTDVTTERLPSDVRRGTWFYQYVARGVALGIVNTRTLFHPASNLTRADAAVWIDGAE